MGDSNFSDIEDEGSSDDSAFLFSAPAALADGAAVVPTITATAAGAHRLQVTEATTPTLAPSEPITSVSNGRPLSTAGTSHQGIAPALAPGETIASIRLSWSPSPCS